MLPPNYLVMTASDAAQHNARHSDRTPFVSLTQVLEERATSSSEQVAAGFATSKGDGLWSWDTFSQFNFSFSAFST